MSFLLANDEHIVKNWAYGTVKSNHQKSNAQLFITNRRIVSVVESKTQKSISEIPLDEVSTISFRKSRYSAAGKALSVIEIIFGVLFSVLIFGIFMIKGGARRIRYSEFSLEITTKGIAYPAISIGMRRGNLRKKVQKIKVRIDKRVVDTIGDEIGAVYLNSK